MQREVFLEAIARLSEGATPPAAELRLITLFGRTTATERITGTESDNVFVARAKQKLAVAEPTEVDEA